MSDLSGVSEPQCAHTALRALVAKGGLASDRSKAYACESCGQKFSCSQVREFLDEPFGSALRSGRRRRWLIADGILILAFLGMLALIAPWSRPATTTGDVHALISSHLSRGASADEVFGFLDSNKIAHTSWETAAAYPNLISEGYGPQTTVIAATIHPTGNLLMARTDTVIYFILDTDSRLVNYVVNDTNIAIKAGPG